MKARLFVLALATVCCSGRPLPLEDGPPTNGPGGGLVQSDLGFTVVGPSPPADIGALDFAVPDDLSRTDLAVAPADMTGGLDAPCLTGGNVVYLNGDSGDWVHPGVEAISVPSWLAEPGNSEADTFSYYVETPADWLLTFSTRRLGQPLAVGRYENAMMYGSDRAGHPGLLIQGNGRGCGSVSGWFEIESISGGPDNGTFRALTATFEQHCDGLPAALRGCVHFEN